MEIRKCPLLVDDFISQTFTVEKDGDNLTIARFNVAAKNVIIPSSIIKIKEYAFKNSSAEYINHLLIPGSIKNIDDSIFSKCKGLYNLVIEDGIKSIGHYSFHYADVRYLYIPDSVKKIGNEAFHWMLEAVSIPKDCTLGNKSFPESTLVIRRK